MIKGIEDRVEDARKLQLKREIEPLIEIVLTALDFDKLLFKEKYSPHSKGRPEIYSQFYWVISPENLRHLDFTYTVPKKPNAHTNFVVSYHKFIARTPDEVKQLQSSGLLERVKKLSPGTSGVLTAEYFELEDTDSGMIVRYYSVDKSNPAELSNVAKYIKQVDSLVAEYMQTMQTKKAVIWNRQIH